MLNDEVIALFRTYIQANRHEETIALLQECLSHNETLTEEEKCWALWNISDRFALLRNPKRELENHKRFEDLLLKMDPKYLHWMVSDGTQKLTLILGGCESYWNGLYQYACENCPKSNENAMIRFESHRAAVPTPMRVPYRADRNHAMLSLEHLRKTWDELKDSANGRFCELTYYTQAIGCYTFYRESVRCLLDCANDSFERILPLLSSENHTEEKPYLLGSWEQLNRARSPYAQASCAIHNYIIQLVNAEEFNLALSCYERIRDFDLHYGNYFYRKIELARSNI